MFAILPTFAVEVFAASLRGRVLDAAGAPVPWASIEALDANGARQAAAQTREDGSFELDVSTDGSVKAGRIGYGVATVPFSLAAAALSVEIRLATEARLVPGVEVSALRRPGTSTDWSIPVERVGARDLRDRGAPIPSLAAHLRHSPEVSAIGRDEYNAAPAIRGLARFRTLLCLDGTRVHSDREIGPSAGFVDPASLESVEIVRGPGSVLYGSDAIGGVILLKSNDAAGGAWAETGWSSVNESFRSVAAVTVPLGSARLSLSGAHASAGDYRLPRNVWDSSSPGRHAVNSGFKRNMGRARIATGSFEGAVLYSLGRGIGRPGREAERFTVPNDEHLLTMLRWHTEGSRHGSEARVYAHPTDWTATVEEPYGTGSRHQERRYRSVEWGAFLARSSLGSRTSSIVGVQADARANVRIHRRLTENDSVGAIVTDRWDRWVDGASLGQVGLFGHGLRRTGSLRWNAGARVDATWREGSSRDKRRVIPTGGLGVSADLAPDLLAQANLATSFREPTVTELFFAGRRPAGYLEGNPDLGPERSYEADLAVRRKIGTWVASATAYGIQIEDYIGTRLRAAGASGAADTLRFENASRARLGGATFEVKGAKPWRGILASASIDVASAADDRGNPLPDISPVRGRLDFAWTNRYGSAGLSWRGAVARREVADGERQTPGYGVLDLRGLVPVGPLQLRLTVDNVFDQEYYERADPISYPDPGRSVGVALRWSEIR